MHDLVMYDRGSLSRPRSIVKKKTAAIFLLIFSMFIGSVSASDVDMNSNAVSLTNMSLNEVNMFPRETVYFKNRLPSLAPVKGLTDPIRALAGEIPVLRGNVTSDYGWRHHPIKHRRKHHNGMDIAARMGEPVLAPASGIVIFSGVKRGYGNVVIIDHGNGYTSLLAHNSRLIAKEGDMVSLGQEVAKAGRTGLATGVHVHVEVRYHGALMNPRIFLAK